MICPFCKDKDTSVIDSRATEDRTAIRRRRVSACCNQRFTTFERVQFREITIIKKNGRKSPFDRDKLTRSVMISLRKRPVDADTIEKFVSKIYRNLEDLGQNEVLSTTIGKFVMDGLKEIRITQISREKIPLLIPIAGQLVERTAKTFQREAKN